MRVEYTYIDETALALSDLIGDAVSILLDKHSTGYDRDMAYGMIEECAERLESLAGMIKCNDPFLVIKKEES